MPSAPPVPVVQRVTTVADYGVLGSRARVTLGRRGVTGLPTLRVAVLRGASTFAFQAAGTVQAVRFGSKYRIGAWLRTDAPGMTVCLRIEEVSKHDDVAPVRTTEACFSPTTKWQHFRIVRKTIKSGDQLRFSIYSYGAEKGDSFDIDGFTVLRMTQDGWKRVKDAFARRASLR